MTFIQRVEYAGVRVMIAAVSAWLGFVLFATIAFMRVAKRFDWLSVRVYGAFERVYSALNRTFNRMFKSSNTHSPKQ